MPNHTDALFDALRDRGHDPALGGRTATIRFELTGGGSTDAYSVAIDKGDIAVTVPGDPAAADCTLRADRAMFERIAGGHTNALAAMLRGDLIADGDPELLISVRKLMPTSKAGGQS
jgi:putative sterol carrier protein